MARWTGLSASELAAKGQANRAAPVVHWALSEIIALKNLYARASCSNDIKLGDFATKVGRLKSNVCRKARELGLTDINRKKKEFRKVRNKFETVEQLRQHQSDSAKERIRINGHPRGALGMKHTVETKKKISEFHKALWADPSSKFNSLESSQRRSDEMLKRIVAGGMRQGYSRTRGGKREDLENRYFRSAWEANYARYLNWLKAKGEIHDWEYEPKTFIFEHIKRGTRAYTPDFRVVDRSGAHAWHEVKGWMDAKSKTRLARFKRCFPLEKLIVVDSVWFKSANKTLPAIIPKWERGTVHV